MTKYRRLFVFNPENEMAIADGSPYYTPPASIRKMAEDLSCLPAYYAGAEDAVWVGGLPAGDFTEALGARLQGIPAWVTEKDREGLEVGEVCPWGRSPRICFLFRGFPVASWREGLRELYGRQTAAKCLRRLIGKLEFVEEDVMPVACASLQEIECVAAGGGFLAKAPWSSSGRGLLRIGAEGVTSKSREWLCGVLKKQGCVMIEREQERVMDFAMEFYACKGTVEFRGFSCFKTGDAGEYAGNYVGSQQRLLERLTVWVAAEKLQRIKEELLEVLTEEIAPRYDGYMGVDMMAYRNRAGEICVQPCLEINLRYTMGVLALFLGERLVAEGSEGVFSIARHAADGDALRFHESALREHPLREEGRRVTEGYIALTPVKRDTRFSAYLQVWKS